MTDKQFLEAIIDKLKEIIDLLELKIKSIELKEQSNFKTLEKNLFTKSSIYEIFKVFKVLCREGLYKEFFEFLAKEVELMSYPNRLINLAKQLSEEQMLALQLSLRHTGSLDRDEKLKKIEQILGDYGLPTKGLSEQQIIGFARFVNSLK